MKPSKANQYIIRTIVKKGLQQIQQDPEREIRKLIDLGMLFSGGRFQSEFFAAAQRELEKENSLYYQIGMRTIQKTAEERLLAFGMNLGYNGLTRGAQQIREEEARTRHNIPWVLFVELAQRGKLDAAALDALVEEGKGLGIFCYVLEILPGYAQMQDAAQVMKRHGDCAFVLLMPPELASGQGMVGLETLNNALIALDIDAEEAPLHAASAKLKEGRLLCSAYTRLGGLKNEMVMEKLERACALDFEMLLLLQPYESVASAYGDTLDALTSYRADPTLPVIPVDLYCDGALIDSNISVEGCCARVSSEGLLTMINMQSGESSQGHDVLQAPLGAALQTALPHGGLAQAK